MAGLGVSAKTYSGARKRPCGTLRVIQTELFKVWTFSSTALECSRTTVWGRNLTLTLEREVWRDRGSAKRPTRLQRQQRAAHRRSCGYWYVFLLFGVCAGVFRTLHRVLEGIAAYVVNARCSAVGQGGVKGRRRSCCDARSVKHGRHLPNPSQHLRHTPQSRFTTSPTDFSCALYSR